MLYFEREDNRAGHFNFSRPAVACPAILFTEVASVPIVGRARFMNGVNPGAFWLRVYKGVGCWEWRGYKNSGGYGVFHAYARKKLMAHRISYQLLCGRIPTGLVIDHLCRNRGCVNPQHLEVVTNRENILRGVGHAAHNARKELCTRGHRLSAGNLYMQRGWRECRECRYLTNKNIELKKKLKLLSNKEAR